jgi:hypothetical protein
MCTFLLIFEPSILGQNRTVRKTSKVESLDSGRKLFVQLPLSLFSDFFFETKKNAIGIDYTKRLKGTY